MNFSKKDTVAFCTDYSGSTDKIRHYWTKVAKIHARLIELGCKIKYVFWDNDAKCVDEAKFLLTVRNMDGYGGTKPSNLLEYCKVLGADHMVLTTDGIISDNEVNRCNAIISAKIDKDNYKINFKSVHCYVIAKTNINMSVIAPFMNERWAFKSYRCLYEKDEELIESYDMAELEALHPIDDYDRILNIVACAVMGKSTPLITLRNAILKKFSEYNRQSKVDSTALSVEFEQHKNISVASVEQFCKQYYAIKANVQDKLNDILTVCDNPASGIYSPEEIKAAAKKRIKVSVPEQEISEETCYTNVKIEGPITFELGSVALMVKRTVLEVDDKLMRSISTNGFYASRFVDVIAAKMFDTRTTVTDHLQLKYNSLDRVSPLTREKIIGLLTFGETDESVASNNYVIAKALFGTDSIVGNPDIWFYVVYLAAKQMPRLAELLPLFETQLVYRMKTSTCNISLSGLYTTIQSNATFGLALRFMISQIEINLPKHQSSVPLFYAHLNHIVDLLNMYGCELPEQVKLYHKALLALYTLVKDVKVLHIDAFRSKWMALYYNFYRVDKKNVTANGLEFREYVLLDGEQKELPEHAGPNRALYYNLAFLIIEENVKVSDFMDKVTLENVKTFYQEPKLLQYWPLYKGFNGDEVEVPICPKTLRPYVKDWQESHTKRYNGDGKVEQALFEQDGRPTDYVFSGTKMYGEFVVNYNKFPTQDEYILYCYLRTLSKDRGHKTIPNVEFCIRNWNQYSKVITEITPERFLEIYASSVRSADRAEMES
jgi:hypothetical protein